MKIEKEEKQAGDGGATSLDDEELARQLHRTISQRISCSLTPLQRKSSVKPETPPCGFSNSSGIAVRAWPRHSQTSPTEPLSQLSHSRQGVAQCLTRTPSALTPGFQGMR